MIKEIKLPEIAENIDSAIVLKILVSKGDKIEKDENVAEMESDKAAFDLPSDVAGVVKEIKISEGDEIKVGQIVMSVETEEESESKEEEKKEEKTDDVQESEEEKETEKDDQKDDEGDDEEDEKDVDDSKKSEEEDKKEKSEKKQDSKDEKEKDEDDGDNEVKEEDDEEIEDSQKQKEKKQEKESKSENDEESEEKQDETSDKKEEENKEDTKSEKGKKEVAAAPSIRRLARELGIDIYKVEGTGAHNRITAEDIKAYSKEIARKSDDDVATGDTKELPDFSKFGEIERKSLSSIRKRIGKNMTASWQNIPHVFQFDKADVTELEEFRNKYAAVVEKEGAKLTITAILLKIMAEALQAFPKFNSSLDLKNEELIYKKYFNIGVAVDTEHGLLVPVVRDVDRKSILQLSKELGDIAENARNKKIKPDQLQGGNIAISNLGGIGGTGFTPIVYSPNVAILGVSRTSTEPVYMDGKFEPRQILPLSLSYDHRVIDGAEGARFLRWFCEALENPLLTMFKGGEE